MVWANVLYIVAHTAMGTILGGTLLGWLWCLGTDVSTGRRFPRDMDYMIGWIIMGGMVLGFVGAFTLSLLAVLRSRNPF